MPNAKIDNNYSADNIRSTPVICLQGRDTIVTLWMDASRQNVPFWDLINHRFVELWKLISVFLACLVKFFSQIIQINHEKVSFQLIARKYAVNYITHAHGSTFSVLMVMTYEKLYSRTKYWYLGQFTGWSRFYFHQCYIQYLPISVVLCHTTFS